MNTPATLAGLAALRGASFRYSLLLGGLLGSLGARAQSDLLVSGPATVPAGIYHNITITPDGDATLDGDITVTGTLRVGGALRDNCFRVEGPGSFVLERYGGIHICAPEGLSASGPSGTVQVTGPRHFSPQGFYFYTGSRPQQTGNGLPAQVDILIAGGDSSLTLTQPLAIRRELVISGGGDVISNGRLLLRSDADTSALLLNLTIRGEVRGSMTMQRAVSRSTRNPGAGYRHFASPMLGSTVADLAAAGFAPVVNAAYNTAAAPGTVTPFPTVFGYDESRVLTSPAITYPPFDRGWTSPASLAEPLVPGRGYTVHLPAAAVINFVGTPRFQVVTVPLTHAGGPNGGWQLLGNPYPGPIDLRLVAPADMAGLDPAIYLFESTGAYTGQYRSYVNGMPGGFRASRVAACQGFFMRISDGQPGGRFTFRRAQMVSSTLSDEQPFGRAAAPPDPRPQLHLVLRGASLADTAYVYAQAGATLAADAAYDARKLLNGHGLNLASQAAGGEDLAINGLPAFTAATVVPLRMTVPVAGTYTLHAARQLCLPAGLQAELLDASTGQRWNLQQFAPTFALPPGPTARFSLVFRPAGVTAATSGLTAAQLILAPNPARGAVRIQVPVPAGTAVTATVINILGQVVTPAQFLPVRTGEARGVLPLTGLIPGVYVVRLVAGATVLSKRLVVEAVAQ